MSVLTQGEVYEQIVKAESEERKLAVASIVATSGSTPQRTGAKLLVFDDGRMLGTVGGGCVEADVWAEARQALSEGHSRLCFFTLRDNPDAPPDEEGMVCGGEMEVFIEVWQNRRAVPLTAQEISSTLRSALSHGHSVALISLMADEGGPAEPILHLLVGEDGRPLAGTLGDPGLDQIAARHACELISDERQEIAVARAGEMTEAGMLHEKLGGLRLLFEISRPPLEMVICGGGHVGQAVAKVARLLDFKVSVIDDRPEFASREKFPDPQVRLLANDFVEALRSLRITPATHLVIVTRGHRHDEICLREVIDKPARYIGMIGSRRRTTTIRERLRRDGVSPRLLRKVHAPIGLDIGAQTPEEIALAILAEIVLIRRGGAGRPKSAGGPMARTRD